jgi:hypothetical protein
MAKVKESSVMNISFIADGFFTFRFLLSQVGQNENPQSV